MSGMKNNETIPKTWNEISSPTENPSLVNLANHRTATASHEFGASISQNYDDDDTECYDAVILYTEKDLEKAVEIVDKINSIVLKGNRQAKAELFDVARASITPSFLHLENVLKVCSYIFILCTDNFNKDFETKYLADECLMSSILAKDTTKPWQVVPIVLDPDIKLQFGLNSLQPIKWYTKHALTKITKMLEYCNRKDLTRSQSMPIPKLLVQESTFNSSQSMNECVDNFSDLSINQQKTSH